VGGFFPAAGRNVQFDTFRQGSTEYHPERVGGGFGAFWPLQAADGKIYGMAAGAATSGPPSSGTFFVMDAGLAPPQARIINFQPVSGKAGSTFLIQGSHFVGTTAVAINGQQRELQRADCKLYPRDGAGESEYGETFGHECGRNGDERESFHGAIKRAA
jgi:hypothetical protein